MQKKTQVSLEQKNKKDSLNEKIKNLSNDYVNIPIEILSDNKISINRLMIDDTQLMPYSGTDSTYYKLVESSEYDSRHDKNYTSDPIEEFQYVVNRVGKMVGMAKRKSRNFDLYYEGNWIGDSFSYDDSGIKTDNKVISFIVTYEYILLDIENPFDASEGA